MNEIIQFHNDHPYEFISALILLVFVVREAFMFLFGVNSIVSELKDIKEILKNK